MSSIAIAAILKPPAHVHALMENADHDEVGRCQAIKEKVSPHGIFQVTWPDFAYVSAGAVTAREALDGVHDTRVIAAGLIG